jgi:hypothetical protein
VLIQFPQVNPFPLPDKKQEEATTVKGGPDPNALLDTKFNKDIMGEIKSQEAFAQRDVVVDLEN